MRQHYSYSWADVVNGICVFTVCLTKFEVRTFKEVLFCFFYHARLGTWLSKQKFTDYAKKPFSWLELSWVQFPKLWCANQSTGTQYIGEFMHGPLETFLQQFNCVFSTVSSVLDSVLWYFRLICSFRPEKKIKENEEARGVGIRHCHLLPQLH